MKHIINLFFGFFVGFVNVVVGACGGVVAVESLKFSGFDQTKAHATAISIIMPLSLLSTAMYLIYDKVSLSDSYVYILPGIVGSLIGAHLLPKVPQKVLGKIFNVFMIYAGIRMLIK